MKRCLREAFWAEAERLPEGSDYVVVARPDARELAEREGMAGVRDRARASSSTAVRGGAGSCRTGRRRAGQRGRMHERRWRAGSRSARSACTSA